MVMAYFSLVLNMLSVRLHIHHLIVPFDCRLPYFSSQLAFGSGKEDFPSFSFLLHELPPKCGDATGS